MTKLRELEAKHGKSGVLFEIGQQERGPRVMGRKTTGSEVTANLRLERVPTAIVHLLDATTHPLVSFEIENVTAQMRRLRLTTYVEGYSASCVDTVEIPGRGKAERSQLMTFFPSQLKQVTELTRATLHTLVDDLDGKQEMQYHAPDLAAGA